VRTYLETKTKYPRKSMKDKREGRGRIGEREKSYSNIRLYSKITVIK
jgi:hypothetical protein